MNEELTEAIYVLREKPTDKTWFIPVMLDDTKVPSRRISAVESLSDLHFVELYKNWDAGVSSIVRVLRHDDPVFARVLNLVALVNKPFDKDRVHAIEQLGDIRPIQKEAINCLVEALVNCSNIEIMAATVSALAKIAPAIAKIVPSDEAVAALVAVLRDPDCDVTLRETAAQALGKIGPAAAEAVPALVEVVKASRYNLAVHAGYSIGEIGGSAAVKAVPELAAVLREEGAFNIGIIEALKMIGLAATEAIPPLLAALRDSRYSSTTKGTVAEGLGRILPTPEVVPLLVSLLEEPGGDPPELYTDRPSYQIWHSAARALGHIGTAAAAAVPALLSHLKHYYIHTDVQDCFAEALVMIGPPAVPALVEAIKDPQWSTSYPAEALAKIEAAAAEPVPALVEALRDHVIRAKVENGRSR
jgi:HEAT repeat protein